MENNINNKKNLTINENQEILPSIQEQSEKNEVGVSFNSRLSFCPTEILNLQKERAKQRRISRSLANKDFENIIFNIGKLYKINKSFKIN